jgi:hypothetical protein
MTVKDENCTQRFGRETRRKETTRSLWEDNIKLDHKMEWKDMERIYLAQDKNQCSNEHDNGPSAFMKFWDVLE